MFLAPEATAAAEGANGDGSMPATELEPALRSLPRGKAPGMDGIPYEFHQRFWPALGREFTDVFHEAFTTEANPALPPSLLQGRITLQYKGKGADRESPASYRPITPLNTEYKLAARTLASRLGPVLNLFVDATQTGFLPKRWVGDNVLAHLGEISYLQETQEPGVMVFLDFEKAFDRLDRAWIERCMAAVGFGPGAQRWVHILHSGTTARVAYNGCTRTPSQSGPALSRVVPGHRCSSCSSHSPWHLTPSVSLSSRPSSPSGCPHRVRRHHSGEEPQRRTGHFGHQRGPPLRSNRLKAAAVNPKVSGRRTVDRSTKAREAKGKGPREGKGIKQWWSRGTAGQ